MEEHRRGKNVALTGALLQLALAGVLTFLWQWTGSQSAMMAAITLAGGVLPWLMAAVLFYCRQLHQQELLELEELAERRAEDASIFQGQNKDTHPAAARLAVVERWVVPAFTLAWAAFHAIVGILLLRHFSQAQVPPLLINAGAAALFMALVVFMAFLFSRYTTGMAHEAVWRPLRATGSYMLVCVLFIVGSAAAMVSAWQGYTAVDGVVAMIVPVLQILLAVELALNFILDLYRPRMPGEEHRLSFDSRLLNLLAEPERIGHSIAETLNYQFGFEVSKTWFYQLLSRSVVWLVLFGVGVMFAMSCLVIVHAGEQAVVLHWGQFDPQRSVLSPGLHFTWPWPIDTVRRFPVEKVHDVWLGAGPARTEEERSSHVVNGKELYLWTEEHGEREEKDFIVAVPPERRRRGAAESETDQIPPVDVIKLVVLVQYRIRDVRAFGFRYADPHEMLASAAEREMVRYCASATLQEKLDLPTDQRPQRAEALMTTGRQPAANELKRLVQDEADDLGLGVKITYVGLVAVHPPKDVAPAFQEVLSAERRRDKDRYNAQAQAHEALAEMAGSPEAALSLAWAIQVRHILQNLAAATEPAERQKKAMENLASVAKQIRYADAELQRQRLLGKLGRSKSKSPLERLRDEYAAHQQSLVQIYLSAGTKPPTPPQRTRLLERGMVPAKLLDEMVASPASYRQIDFAAAIAQAQALANKRSDRASGEQAEMIAQARAERWTVDLNERARFAAMEGQRQAWRASPYLYQWDRWMDVWDEVLPGMSKYVLGVDEDRIEVWLNWERQSQFMEGVDFQAEPPPAARE